MNQNKNLKNYLKHVHIKLKKLNLKLNQKNNNLDK